MMLRICRNKDQAVVNPNPANARRAQTEAEWERKWLLAPEEFNPLLTAAGRLRIERTWELIHPQLASPKLLCVDLGAGYGVLSSLCADAGARMTAADIAEGALKKIRLNQQISCEKQFVPYTTLPDMHYDLLRMNTAFFFPNLRALRRAMGKSSSPLPWMSIPTMLLSAFSISLRQKFLLNRSGKVIMLCKSASCACLTAGNGANGYLDP
jgi:hypothetical protein